MNPRDPFHYKRLLKIDPRRLFFTAKARNAERVAQGKFETYSIPNVMPEMPWVGGVAYNEKDTAVTVDQMRVLNTCLQATENMCGAVVEIGAYRGVTTAFLAAKTKREFIAVDPYVGYGGSESDLRLMNERVNHLANVRHLRMTSGDAMHPGVVDGVSFVFIDAVHDYVNALFDGYGWGERLSAGGVIAFHDADSRIFAGVQRAIWELLNWTPHKYTVFAHINGLVALRRIA